MKTIRNVARVTALTCLFSGIGSIALVSAQAGDPPTIPGYEHTGVSWHTGLVAYPTIPLPVGEQGPEQHTGQVFYLTAYKLKKKAPKPASGL